MRILAGQADISSEVGADVKVALCGFSSVSYANVSTRLSVCPYFGLVLVMTQSKASSEPKRLVSREERFVNESIYVP